MNYDSIRKYKLQAFFQKFTLIVKSDFLKKKERINCFHGLHGVYLIYTASHCIRKALFDTH